MSEQTKTAEHTPGPWEVFDGYDGGRTVCILRSCGRMISIIGPKGAEPKGYEATDANSRLLAAAPDLLAALIRAGQVIDYMATQSSLIPTFMPLLEEINAAISKAKGEEKAQPAPR